MTIQLLDDNPADKDLLGFSRMEEILYGVIREPPRLPFTLGIFADWGSGKTTLMEMISRRLKKEGVKTVWFNAWKYDSKEVIWNALIQQIFYTMANDPSVETRADAAQFKERVGKAAKGLARYAAKVATRFVPGGIVKEEDVDGLIDALSTSATDQEFDFMNRFEDTFDKIVTDYVGGDGAGKRNFLVVFIDDLDRCLPENAINAMEALKLYLDRANCIFVIGAERGIVEEGIRQRYNNNSSLSAEDYLDKIIQLPFVLPRIQRDSALALLGSHSGMPVHGDGLMRRMVIAGTEGNPRRVKRFANAFWVLSQIAGDAALEDQRRLAKVLLIQMRFPRLFDQLVNDLGLVDAMTGAWTDDANRLDRMKESASAAVLTLLENAEIKRFLLATRQVTMGDKEIERWVRLTNTQQVGG